MSATLRLRQALAGALPERPFRVELGDGAKPSAPSSSVEYALARTRRQLGAHQHQVRVRAT